MLITESQMGFNNRGVNALGLLDNMYYLTEAESIFSPAMVPIVENTSVGAHLIRLEDIMTFAESNGIEDLGYALSAVCEAAEVDPSTIAFTVNEETVIADSSIANLVTGIINEGVAVIAKPLNENHPAAILGDVAVEHLLETGDDSLLEAFVTLDEVVDLTRPTNYKGGSIPGRNLTKKEQKAYEKKFKAETRAETDQRNIYDTLIKGGATKVEAKGVIQNWNANHPNQPLTVTKAKQLIKLNNDTKEQIASARHIEAQYQQMQDNINNYQNDIAMRGLGGKEDNKSEDEGGKNAPDGVPSQQATESFLDKVKNNVNKGRDWIASAIAKLHSWAAKINSEIKNMDPQKRSIWQTIQQKITAAIQYLTSKLHNFIKTKDREATADYS